MLKQEDSINNDSPADTCRLFWYFQQNSFMAVGWLQGPRFMWLDNSDFSGPFMKRCFPNHHHEGQHTSHEERHAHFDAWAFNDQ